MEWLAVIIVTVAVLLTAYIKGRSAGEGDAAKEVIDNAAKAKKVADDVAAMPADSRREKLKKWVD